jgi:hypothetical protein
MSLRSVALSNVAGDQVDQLRGNSDDLVWRISPRAKLIKEGSRENPCAFLIGTHSGDPRSDSALLISCTTSYNPCAIGRSAGGRP